MLRTSSPNPHGPDHGFTARLGDMMASGCGLIVGLTAPDGEPVATRGWAVSGWGHAGGRVRVVVTADDPGVEEQLTTGRIAVTGADVRTLDSLQFKGRIITWGPPSEQDSALMADLTARFFEAIHAVDGNPIEDLQRMLPNRVVTVEIEVDEIFDQRPGPGAGSAMEHA